MKRVKRSVMFNTENAPGEIDRAAAPPQRAAAAPAADGRPPLSALADPLWIIAALWRRKGLILLCAVLGFVLAALASLLVPPKYVSTAQLFIDPRDLRVLQNEVSPNAVNSDPTSVTAYLESQARVIASDSIKSRVVEREHLDKDPEFGGVAAPGLLSRLFDFGGASRRDGMLYALAELDKRVAVRRGERTFVIDIAVTSRDPEKAARIANALANAYLEDQAAVRDAAARRATDSLTSRLEELRSRLRTAEDKAEKFKEANNLVVASGRSMSEEQLSLNNAQLVAVRTRVTEAKAKYDEILRTRASAIEAGSIPEAVASNTMTALRSQLGAALNKEADLTASLGARHPALAAAQAQVRDARRQISDELARIARAAKSEYDRALAAERQLAGRVDELKTGQFAAGRAAVELRELEREVESSRIVYEGFLRRARETGELSGIDTTNARIISQAMPPLEKSGLSRRTFAMLGGIGGLGVGSMLALALAYFGAPRLPSPGDDAHPLRMPFGRRKAGQAGETAAPQPDTAPLAAAVPALVVPPARPAPSHSGKPGWRRLTAIAGGKRLPDILSTAAAPLLATVPVVRHRRWRREQDETRSVFQGKRHLVDVLDKPQASFARAIGQIREALASAGEGAGNRRILVVGLRSGAGASTIALNLALDAAVLGKAAMLADAGLGEAGLTATFAPDARTGLQDIVSGAAGVVRAALQDEGTGLFFLPRLGQTGQVTATQISRDFFGAARRFGPIIVDGAAIGTDDLTQRFAEAVDDIVLVLREGEIGRGDLEQATATLGPHAAKIRGFVVNEA